MPKEYTKVMTRQPKLTAVRISELPELITVVELSDMNVRHKDKIVTNLMLVAHLADKLEQQNITIAKLQELFGVKAKVLPKEV